MATDPTTWKDIFTIGFAFVGAVLGIFNTSKNYLETRIKLRVKPAFAQAVGGGEPMVAIEVINLSRFSVTITGAGFTIGNSTIDSGPRAEIAAPIIIDGGKWPRRLETGEAVSVYTQIARLHGNIGKAYARTASEEVAYGTSPALEQIKEVINQKK